MDRKLEFCLLPPLFGYTTTYVDGMTFFAQINEPEGISYLVEVNEKVTIDQVDFLCKAIQLSTITGLEEVGVTAGVSNLLMQHNLPCNVIAGKYHDYFFIPHKEAEKACEILNQFFG